jgi:molybdopterin converting factor small subunit
MMEKTPKVEARFHGGLQRVFQEKVRQVDLSKAPNVRGLFEALCSSPAHRRELFDDDGHIRSNLLILKNGRNIALLSGLDTELNDGDTVAILLPVYGG